LSLTVVPKKKDIFGRRNQILMIDSTGISVTAIPEKTAIKKNASDAAFNG